jgi:hypothetical protein
MASLEFLMSKLININSSTVSSSLAISNKSYINSQVEIDGFMNIEKISKLVKILTDNDIEKIKSIIEADIDKELSAFLIKDSHLGDDYLINIFSSYIKSGEYHSKSIDLYEIIINRLESKSSLTKVKIILDSIFIKNESIYKNICDLITEAQLKIPNSFDYIKED